MAGGTVPLASDHEPPTGRCDRLHPGSVPVSFSLRAIGTQDQTGEASTGSPPVDTALAPGRGQGGCWLGARGQATSWCRRVAAPAPQVARQSLTIFVLIMNGGHIEIDAHRLNDGGLLLSYDGNSYTTYMKEEVDRWGGPERAGRLCSPSWLLILVWGPSRATLWGRGAPDCARGEGPSGLPRGERLQQA